MRHTSHRARPVPSLSGGNTRPPPLLGACDRQGLSPSSPAGTPGQPLGVAMCAPHCVHVCREEPPEPVCVCGCTWVCMGVHGYVWVYMGVHGCTSVYMGMRGCPWVCIWCTWVCTWCTYGCLQVYMDVCVWAYTDVYMVYMGVCRCTWMYMGVHVCAWTYSVHMGIYGCT